MRRREIGVRHANGGKEERTEDNFALGSWARRRFRDEVHESLPSAILLEIALDVNVHRELLHKGPRERLGDGLRRLRKRRGERNRRF